MLNHLLPNLSKEIIDATNANGSPAIHWAVFNNHVGCVKALVEVPEERGGGLSVLKVRFCVGTTEDIRHLDRFEVFC